MTWWPRVQRLGPENDPYLTRIMIGRLYIHIFHRGDADPDPHDHPWDFWTFPLVSYWEERWWSEELSLYGGRAHLLPYAWTIRAFRPHWVRAEHVHRVIGRADERPGPVVTIVWRGPKVREWGFWTEEGWLPWRRYFGMPEEAATDDRVRMTHGA
jgi:hypothetical protein